MKNHEIEKLNDILGVANSQLESDTDLIVIEERVDDLEATQDIDYVTNVKLDYLHTRSTLKSLLSKGEAALNGVIKLANEEGSPRSFELASVLINTISTVSKDLMMLHREMKSLSHQERAKVESINTTNNVFVGSTKELLKMMNKND